MWTAIQAQPDGQYFGLHQYFRTSDCSFIERGMIALRVLQNEQGQTFLRVCFDDPERDPDVQPKIAAGRDRTPTPRTAAATRTSSRRCRRRRRSSTTS